MNTKATEYLLVVECPCPERMSAALFCVRDKSERAAFDAAVSCEAGLDSVIGKFLAWIDEIDSQKVEYTMAAKSLERDCNPVNRALRAAGLHSGLCGLKGNKNKTVVVLESFYRGAAHLTLLDDVGDVEKLAFIRLHMAPVFDACPYTKPEDSARATAWRACAITSKMEQIQDRPFHMRVLRMALDALNRQPQVVGGVSVLDIQAPVIEQVRFSQNYSESSGSVTGQSGLRSLPPGDPFEQLRRLSVDGDGDKPNRTPRRETGQYKI